MAEAERHDDRNPNTGGSGKRKRSHEEQDLLRPRSLNVGKVKLLPTNTNIESRSVLTLTLVNADDGPYSNGTSISRPWNRDRSVSPERPLAPLILPSAVARHGPPALKRPNHIVYICAPKSSPRVQWECPDEDCQGVSFQNVSRDVVEQHFAVHGMVHLLQARRVVIGGPRGGAAQTRTSSSGGGGGAASSNTPPEKAAPGVTALTSSRNSDGAAQAPGARRQAGRGEANGAPAQDECASASSTPQKRGHKSPSKGKTRTDDREAYDTEDAPRFAYPLHSLNVALDIPCHEFD